MLVLDMQIGQSFTIGESKATFLGMRGKKARIAIKAPKQIPIEREDRYKKRDREGITTESKEAV